MKNSHKNMTISEIKRTLNWIFEEAYQNSDSRNEDVMEVGKYINKLLKPHYVLLGNDQFQTPQFIGSKKECEDILRDCTAWTIVKINSLDELAAIMRKRWS